MPCCDSASSRWTFATPLWYLFLVSKTPIPSGLLDLQKFCQQHNLISFQNNCQNALSPTAQPCTQKQDKCHIHVSEESTARTKARGFHSTSVFGCLSPVFLSIFLLGPFPRLFHGFICPNHAVSQIVVLALCLSCSYL